MRYRVTIATINAAGIEFEADDDATPEEVQEAAWAVVQEYVDFGYEAIEVAAADEK